MSSTNQKQSDAELIQRRTNAWNNRPIRSMEMFAKTSYEHRLVNKAKRQYKRNLVTPEGIQLKKNVQKHILKLELIHNVKFT
jgi:hypothetical protein